ncbi:hypothetical protein [Acetivibrio sp. MSJd-27]|uniref:hypothetical protein n=1 Tax=Acetivibrio sp. MSJd-27 TaxID=2841523 RepID=UPI001C105E84|nr:hypothetical protein [Acetivibrio sp. MSJd-27]MBU5451005.1 hypothetical protein [Acetivibrio sp. MSJd-27]
MKRFFSLFIAMLLLLSGALIPASAEDTTSIFTGDEFVSLIKANPNGSFVLENNITLPTNYAQIESFGGTLDGNNKTITVTMNGSGIFGKLSGSADVHDLTIAGTINGGSAQNVGALAGTTVDCTDGKVTNVTNTATVKGSGSNFGGIFGTLAGSITATYLINTGDVTTTSYYVGGIAGYQSGQNTVILQYAANMGNITAGNSTAGGIVGWSYGNIYLCYNTGKVQATNDFVGGILGIGLTDGAIISKCYNAGEIISSKGAANAGGILGGVRSGRHMSVTRGYNVGKVNGVSYNAQIAPEESCYYAYMHRLSESDSDRSDKSTYYKNPIDMTSENMKQLDQFDGLETSETAEWQIADGGYPYPQLVGFLQPVGTVSNPIAIRDAADFLDIEKNSSKAYRLEADITLPDYEPFIFSGKLDGNGKVITVIQDVYKADLGLFSALTGTPDIKDLTIEGKIGAGVSKGMDNIGALAGKASECSGGFITNVVNKATVNGYYMVGGIFGKCANLTMKNVRNEGTVRGDNAVGGVIGYSPTAVAFCGNSGLVNANNSTVGGVVGWTYSNVSNCWNIGKVSAKNGGIGGVVGILSADAKISDCYNAGTISSQKVSTGGILGSTAKNVSVSNCYNIGTASHANTSGPIAPVGLTSVGFSNCYYLSASDAEEDSYNGTTAKTLADMQSMSMVAMLGGSFENGTEDYSFPQLANFPNNSRVIFYTVTVNVSADGTINVPAENYVKEGEDFSFQALPNDNCYIDSIQANGVTVVSENVGARVYSMPQVTEDTTISVTFVPMKETLPDILTIPTPAALFLGTEGGVPYGISFATVKNIYNGYTVEYGILFTSDSSKANLTDMVVDGDNVLKAPAVTPANALGQFGIRFCGIKSGKTYYTRAYAVYQNTAGEKRYYYSDIRSFES